MPYLVAEFVDLLILCAFVVVYGRTYPLETRSRRRCSVLHFPGDQSTGHLHVDWCYLQ